MTEAETGSSDATGSAPRMIAVSSGKGGVGKSTVTVNVAVAMAQGGLRVGVVDADVYGPSIPGMLGIATDSQPAMSPDRKVVPAMAHGVKVISMAMLSDDDKPAILRGPMVTKYLHMFVGQVDWGGLDVLLLDLPPGTGDIQLTLAQAFPLTGAVVVSTPQDVSLKIARRGLRMMEQVRVPILGLVENMSGFTCPNCGSVTHVFHQGGGERIAQELGVDFLGRIPLDPSVVDSGDDGVPLVVSAPESPAAEAYRAIAARLWGGADAMGGLTMPFTWNVVEHTGKPAEAPPGPDAPPELPVGIDMDDTGLLLRWADGLEQRLPPRDLRLACRCASCRDEVTGKRLLDPDRIPLDIRLTRVSSVGNYAFRLSFSDGHDTGIYTFNHLRELEGALVEDV